MTHPTNRTPQPVPTSRGPLGREFSSRPVEGRNAGMSPATPSGDYDWLTAQPDGDQNTGASPVTRSGTTEAVGPGKTTKPDRGITRHGPSWGWHIQKMQIEIARRRDEWARERGEG